MRINITLLFLILCVTAHVAAAQTDLHVFMDKVRSGQQMNPPLSLTRPSNSNVLLKAIRGYVSDTSALIRRQVNVIVRAVGLNAGEILARQQAVSLLIGAGADKDASNTGLVFKYLSEFKKEDFNKISKDSLKGLFLRKPPHFDQLLRLIGFLEVTELKEEIMAFTQPGNNKRDRWAAHLALARMGDAEMKLAVIDRVRRLPPSDDVVMEIFPDLVYTRQKESINYMIEVLNSDDKNCRSADNDNPVAIPCGYRVMEQLAGVIKDYPLQKDASGDIKTDDYVKALATVREWFKSKGTNYEIDRSKF